MKIVILDGYPVNPGDLDWNQIASLGSLTVYDRTAPEDIEIRCTGADIVLTNKVALGEKDFSRLASLRYVGVLSTGYNVVDTEAARRHGVTVTNIPAYSTESVAQQAISLLLTITNHAEHYAIENRRGRWTESKYFCYSDYPVCELAGKRIGIVGYGNTGQATARVAQALGMNVAVFSSRPQEQLPEVEKMNLDELFECCDVISLHCPLADDTFHLVDTRRISLMKPGAILINTGRGPLVDEQALADALNSGKILAAGLDVLSSEPPAADNPLLKARNCYITPHLAWASFEARKRLIETAASNIRAFVDGNPVNVVS